MKYFFCSLILSVFTISGFSQGLSIVKIDNTQFPAIKVYASVDADSAKKSDFKIFELDKEVDFKFDTLPAAGEFSSKAILFMAQQELFETDSMNLGLIAETFTMLKEDDKMNACYFSGKDTVGTSYNMLSAEFSNSFAFFRNNFEDAASVKITNNKYEKDFDNFFSRLNYSLNFFKTREGLPVTKALFIFSDKIEYLDENNLKRCISIAQKNNISIYVADAGENEAPVTNHFIKLCTKTGGIYTRIENTAFPSTIYKYIEDVNAGIKLPASHSYTLTFNAQQKEKVNNFEIEANDKRVKTFYTKKAIIEEFTIREFFLIGITICVILLFVIVNFVRKAKAKKNTEPEIVKKPTPKEFALVAATEPVLIVNTKGKIKSYRITKSEINIGRRTDNSISITDATVSAYHAQIFYYSGKFYVKDLDSTNGVYVNGEKETYTELKNNDKVKIGVSLITIRFAI